MLWSRAREAAPIPASSASRPTCLTGSGRLGGAAAAGRRRHFFLVFHRALPDLQRMKHKPDQALGHREVFCFFLAELLLADYSGADAGARASAADADVGFAWSGRRRWCRRRSSAASYGVIDNDRKFRSTDSGGPGGSSPRPPAGCRRSLCFWLGVPTIPKPRRTCPRSSKECARPDGLRT